MTRAHPRPLFLTLLVAWVGVVAYLTLTPSGHTPPLTAGSFLCVACGVLDGSDIIRNWILFLPGGLLAALTLRPIPALALLLCLTVCVEFVQIGVPGRDPALQDVIFNALGAGTGVLLMRQGLPRWGQRVVAAAAVVSWLGPLVLLTPKTTPFDLYGLWTPRLGNEAHYSGRVIQAAVGDLAVESRLVLDKPTLDAAITGRKPIRLLMRVGTAPASLAPIFEIRDAEEQLLLEISALGSDLILRGRNPARILRLDQPDARWSGAMLGVPVGDTVDVLVDRARDSVCMSVGEREQCNLAPSLADGWGHILYLEGPPAWFRALVALGWAAGLGGLMGLTAASRRSALALATTLAVGGYIGSHLSPDVRPNELHAAVLVGGALLGATLRSHVVQLWTALRPR